MFKTTWVLITLIFCCSSIYASTTSTGSETIQGTAKKLYSLEKFNAHRKSSRYMALSS
jgi:hypothetical protein